MRIHPTIGRIATAGILLAATIGLTEDKAHATQPVLQEQWIASTPASQKHNFGTSIDAAGDVNGDGFDDLVVGANGDAYLFRGSASGLKLSPSWSAGGSGQQSMYNFGRSVAGVGDVNADGYDDVLVGDMGAPDGTKNGHIYYDGRVYLYLGSSSGLSSTADQVIDGSPSRFGGRVSAAGDVDGDGHQDVLVAAVSNIDMNNCSGGHSGGVQLYRGTNTGLETTKSWSEQPNMWGTCFGYAISTAGDVNGDGFDDVVIGEPYYPLTTGRPVQRGKVYVYEGSSTGLGSSPLWTERHPQLGGAKGLWFGNTLSGGGDVDSDGFDDIVISSAGIYAADGKNGLGHRGFVYEGSLTGPSATPDDVLESGYANLIPSGITLAGKVNQDGFEDVLFNVGGRVELYHGSSSGVVTTRAWYESASNYLFGNPSSEAGDVNGDGFADIASKVSGSISGQKVHVFHGAPNPPPTAQPTSAIVDRGHPREITLQGSDFHNEPLTFSITTDPQHGGVSGLMSSGRSAATVTYYPPWGPEAEDQFKFTVADPLEHTATATVDITIKSPPTFVPPTPEGTVYGSSGESVKFTIAADDPDGDTILYDVEPMPDGASIDKVSGQFQWTPGNDQGGRYTVDLEASDGVATIQREVVLDILAPAMDVGPGGDDAGDAGMEMDVTPTDTSGDASDASDALDSSNSLDGGSDAAVADASDAESPMDSAAEPETGSGNEAPRRSQGCGCNQRSSPSPVAIGWWLLLVGGVFKRRWRRAGSE